MEWIITLKNINEVAKDFWKNNGDNKVFAFHGEMGAGKTTFIHALCGAKGVKDVVSSPTFAIINEYNYVPIDIGSNGTLRVIFHLDLYRMHNELEAARAGVEEVLNSGSTCLVEWPEQAPGLFPGETVHIYMEWVDEQTRRIKIPNI